MNKIRVDRGLEIEVNDAGETICIPMDDMMFIENFNDLIDAFDKVEKEIEEKEGKLTEKEELRLIVDKTKNIMDKINALFRDERCCDKVFGDIVPAPWLLADFFEQLLPFVKKHSDERQKAILSKYSNKRRGARSK